MTLSPTVPCGSCGAPMYWTPTEAGGRMPLDPEPRPEGNVELVEGVALVHGKNGHMQSAGGPLYRTHFATCPNAKKHRKRK